MLRRIYLSVALMLFSLPALGQGTVPGQLLVPVGFCQLGVTALSAAVKLSAVTCQSASFTASAGTDSTQLVVTSVTGRINIGQVVAGTGITAGTTVTAQVSGTTGGAGTYQLSASNTTSAASVTAGGIPTGATMAYLDAEVAGVRYRDDGGVPTATVGSLIATGNPGIFYTGTLTQIQFIAATGSPLLNVSFYR